MIRNCVLLLACLGLGACTATNASSVPPIPPPGEAWLSESQIAEAKMKVEPVVESEIGASIVTTGRIAFNDLFVSHIFSPVTGRIIKIMAEPGARVKKGEALATLESPDLGVASSDLDKARAELVAAEHERARQKALYEAHAGAQRDLETAEDNYAKARAEFERAKQKTKLLRTRDDEEVSQNYTLRSLIDGEVIARTINPGMEVQGQYSGGSGAAPELFTIGELDSVWVLGDLFEMDLGRVQTGQHVEVTTVAYPNVTFAGTVDWVSATLDPATRTAKIRCTIKNVDHKLKPEMFATMTIGTVGKKVLAVARPSVFKLGGKTVVFVQVGKTPAGQLRFARRPVVVDDDEAGEMVPVLHGLEVGEQVVTAGGILLSNPG